MKIEELRALRGRAPSGPWMAKAGHNEAADQWDVVDENGAIVSEWSTRDEAQLIAAAVNALPALLDVAEAAERAWLMVRDSDDGDYIVACGRMLALRDALAALTNDHGGG